jgi:hypothetical protein
MMWNLLSFRSSIQPIFSRDCGASSTLHKVGAST